MGKAVITGSGGGGAGSDECTATKIEVLKGYKAITKDSDDELIEGTLELTGTAADSQVLSGQTYYNTDVKTKRTGAMANRGAVSQALNAGGSYTIPAGFHNGSGKVTANGLSGQTSATAAAGHILSGQTAWVNGSKITGNMANQGTKTASLNCGGSYTIPAGYHNGSGKVTVNSLASQTGGATADDSKVLSGYTYWKDGAKRTGNLTVSSVVSFSAAQYSNLTLIASWAKPSKGPWSGVCVMCKQGGYPNSVSDGTLFYEGSATSATKTLESGIWYLRAWNYMTTSGGRIYGVYVDAWCINSRVRGKQTFTASGIFTIPANVRSVDIFCVGGGGSGGSGGGYVNAAWNGRTQVGSGGGGGYVVTNKNVGVTPGNTLSIIVGAGGSSVGEYNINTGLYKDGITGGVTKVMLGNSVLASANGGGGGSSGGWNPNGGNGGSGGGGGLDLQGEKYARGGDGGLGGGNGEDGKTDRGQGTTALGGKGQGTTTKEFGDATGYFYGGGGGGGSYHSISRSLGGGGGGGDGGRAYRTDDEAAPGSGEANTGGGGGGTLYGPSGAGGSGICIIRWGY